MYFGNSVFVALAHEASNLKYLNHEINYKKKNEPTKYSPEKNSDPRNIHEKKFQTHEAPTRKKVWTHEIPTRKILDPQNTHEKKFWTRKIPTNARWHDGTKPTRPTIKRDPRNLAHSFSSIRGFSFRKGCVFFRNSHAVP